MNHTSLSCKNFRKLHFIHPILRGVKVLCYQYYTSLNGYTFFTHPVYYDRKMFTANTLTLIEKYFLNLRNMFPNQENIGYFSQNKENKLTEKNFLVPSARKFDLN